MLDQFGEAVHDEVGRGVDRYGTRRTAGRARPAIDPDRCDAEPVGRLDVVAQRLGDVDVAAAVETPFVDRLEEALEVRRGRLVRVDVLGGDHRVELDAEPRRGVVEEHRPVDVRQDDQLGVVLERAEPVGDVVEHRPVVEGRGERLGVGVVRLDAELPSDVAVHPPQDFAVAQRRPRRLVRRLRPRVRGEQVVVGWRDPVARRPRAQGGEDPGLPVGERAVAVERHARGGGEVESASSPRVWPPPIS